MTCCVCLGEHDVRDCPTGAPEMPIPRLPRTDDLVRNKDGALRRQKMPKHLKARLIRGQGIKRGQR